MDFSGKPRALIGDMLFFLRVSFFYQVSFSIEI